MKPGHKNMTIKSPMYIYATEMVSSYYQLFNLVGKTVLSIVGSGDQVINAYFLGAEKVVGFDINRRAGFILDLKFQAIKHLEYKEFLQFFGSNSSDGSLDFKLYQKIRIKLSVNTRTFFDKIYQEFGNNGKRVLKSNYFRQRDMIRTPAAFLNNYLKNEKNYLKCRSILQFKKIQFICLDINDILNKKLNTSFDIINLSNVLNYLTGNIKDAELLTVLSAIVKKVSQKINKNGLIFYYSYSPSLYKLQDKAVPPASRHNLIKEIAVMNDLRVSIKNFAGTNEGTLDRINIFSYK